MILTQFAGANPGLTLTDILTVIMFMVIVVSASLPALTTEVDALRLRSASQATAAALNAALMTAERRRESVEITVSPNERRISTRTIGTNSTLCLDLPDGIEITTDSNESVFIVNPNGKIPAIKVSLMSKNGAGCQIWVNPASGVVHEKVYQARA